MADDYEIIPKSDIELLKEEIENIKKDPLKHSPTDLKTSIQELNETIKSLMKVFSLTAKKLKDSPSELPSGNLESRFEKLENQNRDIAKALISIGDSLKEFKLEMRELKDSIQGMKKPKIIKDEEVGSFWKQKPQQRPQFPQEFPSEDNLMQNLSQRREVRDKISMNQMPPPVNPQQMNPPSMNPMGANNSPMNPPFGRDFKPNIPPSMPPPPPPKRK